MKKIMFISNIFLLFIQIFGAEKEMAISLKNLQNCLQNNNCPPAYENLFGLREISGIMVLENEEDVIIFGRTGEESPNLYLEDFVIALKNAFYKYSKLKGNTIYYENPGCSIDPDEQVMKELLKVGSKMDCAKEGEMDKILDLWKSTCQKEQNVRVMGIPFNTRFAKVMVEADYFMKKIVDGSEKLNIEGFLSLTDMEIKKIQETLKEGRDVDLPPFSLNRFWFYPGEVNYSYDEDTFILEECPVILLTEEEYISKQGISGTGKQNLYAKAFSENFSNYYKEISKSYVIYKDLENLFRFVSFAKILASQVDESYFNFFLNNFKEKEVDVPKKLKGISNVKELTIKKDYKNCYTEYYFWLPSCGGVSIDIEKNKIKKVKKNYASLKSTILLARKSKKVIFWEYRR